MKEKIDEDENYVYYREPKLVWANPHIVGDNERKKEVHELFNELHRLFYGYEIDEEYGILCAAESFSSYGVSDNESSVKEKKKYADQEKYGELLAHLDEINEELNFSDYFMEIFREKNIFEKESEFYDSIYMTKQAFNKVKNGCRKNSHYCPDKRTVLKLCLGLQLDLEDSIDLLSHASHSFNPKDTTDEVVKYFIKNKKFTREEFRELDNILTDYKQKTLFSET